MQDTKLSPRALCLEISGDKILSFRQENIQREHVPALRLSALDSFDTRLPTILGQIPEDLLKETPQTLACAVWDGIEQRREREDALRKIFTDTGLGLSDFLAFSANRSNFFKNHSGDLQAGGIRGIKECIIVDGFCSIIYGVISNPGIKNRSFRQGILIAHLGYGYARAALVYQGRLMGIAERRWDTGMNTSDLVNELESFRLGWLPPEKARLHGGFSITATLPSEAEGFKPAYLSGPDAALLSAHGKIAGGNESYLLSSYGLYYALWGQHN